MIDVLLTGGIGSGKSTVARFFEILGTPVYYADKEANWLIENQPQIVTEITALFGEEAYENGQYNRAYIAARVFEDTALLKKLNGIVHPQVGAHYEKWKETQKGHCYIIKEAALVSKSTAFDRCIFVYASKEERIRRVLQRDPLRSQTAVENIMDKQLTAEGFRKFADFEIENEHELLIPQILKIDEVLKFNA
ncbi:dephospho-CoA kinase [Marinilongibacter aquaticus]|uniref:dephospho-CoA kinase n=1 Tax=Marinilongibacter aquaticus TaxID=2975157 RepID=UPI0021BD84A1|nr:dephospho-CoA kinase [Marinilongibacter aquaticus]UBM60459.1 dephospho-CoA kinase [Marinilongibacter aquaticus]